MVSFQIQSHLFFHLHFFPGDTAVTVMMLSLQQAQLAIQIITGIFVGGVGVIVSWYYLGLARKDNLEENVLSSQIDKAADALGDTSLPKFSPPSEYVQRESLKKALYSLVADNSYTTVVISGARGAGKSLLVADTFSGQSHALQIFAQVMKETNNDNLVKSIVQALIHTEHCDLAFLRGVLKKHKAKGLPPPLLILDINERWNSGDLLRLFHLSKILSYDEKLCKVVFVLSTHIQNFTLQISTSDLRAFILEVPEVSVDQCREFYSKVFKALINDSPLKLSENQVTSLVELCVANGERNFNRMKMLTDRVRNCLTFALTFAELKQHLLKQMEFNKQMVNNAFDSFFEVLNLNTSRKEVRKLLASLAEGNHARFEMFQKNTGFDVVQLKEANLFISPHIFIVDTYNRDIYIPSNLYRKVLKERLQEKN